MSLISSEIAQVKEMGNLIDLGQTSHIVKGLVAKQDLEQIRL